MPPPLLPLLALLASLSPQAAQVAARPGPATARGRHEVVRPNVLVVIADDLGVDLLAAYGEGSAPPCTPNLDALAAAGALYRNAWANPVCSPTRAALMTGRHGFRTGIGGIAVPQGPGLSLAEEILPEVLTGYASAFLGKWHLAGNLGDLHPNQSGFGHFAGTVRGSVPDYSSWIKVTDGQSAPTTTYATTDVADGAVAAIQSLAEPWLVVASFHAPHTPFHEPPAALCPVGACSGVLCEGSPQGGPARARAMTEALDTELGRVLAALDARDPDAWVFFLGDNGTAGMAVLPPHTSAHAKGTLYEGGVNVPLLVRGPGVVPGERAALVSAVDLFATLAELAGVPGATEDSVSLVSTFADPASPGGRETVYAESFSPNGASPPFPDHTRAVRDARYKLIRSTAGPDELYDLLVDPFETNDLLPALTPEQQAAYDALHARLVALGVG